MQRRATLGKELCIAQDRPRSSWLEFSLRAKAIARGLELGLMTTP